MIRRAALVLLLGAEALAFYTIGEVFMRIFPEPGNELVSAPGFVVIAFVSFFAPAVLDWFGIGAGKRALAVGVVGLVLLYGLLRLQYAGDLALWDFAWLSDFVIRTGTIKEWIPAVMTSSFLLVLLWAWAAWRSRSGVWIENAPRSLAVPFALVTVALLISAGSEQAEYVTRGGVVFYGVALAALACSQLSQSGSSMGSLRSGSVTTALLVGTAAFAVLGVLLVGVLLEPLIDVLSTPASVVGRAIAWFLTYTFFIPIAWVLSNLFEFVLWLLGADGNSEPPQIEVPVPPETEGGEGQAVDGDSLAARAARYTLAGGAIFLGVAAVAALIFILAVLRRRAGDRGLDASESEAVGSLGEDLRGAARNLLRRDRRREATGEGVTRLYLEVLESARREGRARREGQTPHEFAPVLTSTFHQDVTDEITAAFEYARYSGRPPDESALSDLRRRWESRD